jgi:hypothetical protein
VLLYFFSSPIFQNQKTLAIVNPTDTNGTPEMPMFTAYPD